MGLAVLKRVSGRFEQGLQPLDGRCLYSTDLTHLIIPIGYRTCSTVVVPQQRALLERALRSVNQASLAWRIRAVLSVFYYMSIRIMVTLTLW
jgi:hypothetical protein